jgi:hypothetical protein
MNIGEHRPSQYIILHSQTRAIWYTAWDNIHQYSCNNPIVFIYCTILAYIVEDMNYFFYIVESPTYKQNDVNYVNMVFWRIIIVFILQMIYANIVQYMNTIGLLHEYWWILSQAVYHIARVCEGRCSPIFIQ